MKPTDKRLTILSGKVDKEIRFLKGRVKFIGINTKGEKVSNKCGMHDSMIVVLN